MTRKHLRKLPKKYENENQIDKRVLITSIIIVAVIIFTISLFSETAEMVIDVVYNFVMEKLGVFYIAVFIITLLFSIWICVGSRGNIRLGVKEEFSDFNWAVMMICTGIAGSVMVFGIIEPLNFLNDPPFGIEPMSSKAFEYAHMLPQYYWGISYWVFSVPVALLVGHHIHNNKGTTSRVGKIVFGNKNANIVAALTDITAIVGTLGGVCTSALLATPLICAIISRLFHVDNNLFLRVLVLIIWFSIYTVSTWRGLDKGIKKLSQLNILLLVFFLIFVLVIIGPINFLETEINSIGLYIQNFIRIAFYTDPYCSGGFPQRWSVFYYAYDISYVFLLGTFIGRISKGKTVRKIVLGTVCYGSIGAMIPMAILSSYSLMLQRRGDIDLVSELIHNNNENVVIRALEMIPASGCVMFFFAILAILFMATTIDSTAYILAYNTTRLSKSDTEPLRWNRIFWSFIIIILTFFLMGLNVSGLIRKICIIFSLPIVIVQIMIMYKLKSIEKEKQ